MAESSTVAYVFPGQGSQNTGMGLDLYNGYPSARKVYDEADCSLGFPLSRLCFDGPEEELTKTHNVQPAILVTSIACLKALEDALDDLPPPAYVAGHSLGEYTALVAAGALNVADAVLLVRERGRLTITRVAFRPDRNSPKRIKNTAAIETRESIPMLRVASSWLSN